MPVSASACAQVCAQVCGYDVYVGTCAMMLIWVQRTGFRGDLLSPSTLHSQVWSQSCQACMAWSFPLSHLTSLTFELYDHETE